MYKKFVSIFLLFFVVLGNNFFYVPYVSAESCVGFSWECYSKCTECVEANKSWDARWISDFICLESTNDVEIVIQIILDEKFRELDEEVLDYMDSLDQWKEYSMEKLDEVVSVFSVYWEFWNKYVALCKTGIIEEYFKCSEKASASDIRDFLWSENDWRCIQLVNKKMSAYREIIYGMLKINKLNVRKEARRTYTKAQRERYDELVNIWYMILWYLTRMWKAWQTKTANPYGC